MLGKERTSCFEGQVNRFEKKINGLNLRGKRKEEEKKSFERPIDNHQ